MSHTAHNLLQLSAEHTTISNHIKLVVDRISDLQDQVFTLSNITHSNETLIGMFRQEAQNADMASEFIQNVYAQLRGSSSHPC